MKTRYRYEIQCEGAKNLGSADWFNTPYAAAKTAMQDFSEFRKGTEVAQLQVLSDNYNVVDTFELRNGDWSRVNWLRK